MQLLTSVVYTVLQTVYSTMSNTDFWKLNPLGRAAIV
jgi:hypothetical protein